MNLTFFEYPDPFVWWHVLLYLLSVAWGSFIVGCFGVGGGAVFAPLMLFLPGMTPRLAVGTVFLGCVPSSTMRVLQLRRYGLLDVRSALPLMLGASAGALAGQAALKFVPGAAAAYLVAVVAIWAGVQIQRKVMKEMWSRKSSEAAATDASANPPAPEVVLEEEPCHDSIVQDNNKKADDGQVPFDEFSKAAIEANATRAAPPFDVASSSSQAAPEDLLERGEGKGQQLGEGEEQQQQQQQQQPTQSSEGESRASDAELLEAAKLREQRKEAWMKLVIGFLAALLSSISGTGGPLILFPIYLMWKPDKEMKHLVGESGGFALVTVACSAIGAILFGEVDVGMALVFCSVAVVFTVLGGMMMKRMGDSNLKLGIGAVLILVGCTVAVRTSLSLA